MSPEDRKKTLVTIVTDTPAIKGTELITKYIAVTYEKNRNFSEERDKETGEDIIESINELVKDGELIEVEYVLPSMDYRIKSLYFPKGTLINRPDNLSGNNPLSPENTRLLQRVLHPTGRTSGKMTLDDLGNLLDAARKEQS